jgi:hypothetical protein
VLGNRGPKGLTLGATHAASISHFASEIVTTLTTPPTLYTFNPATGQCGEGSLVPLHPCLRSSRFDCIAVICCNDRRAGEYADPQNFF